MGSTDLHERSGDTKSDNVRTFNSGLQGDVVLIPTITAFHELAIVLCMTFCTPMVMAAGAEPAVLTDVYKIDV